MEVKKVVNFIFVRMDRGEDFFENLRKIAEQFNIYSGIIVSALGQLEEFTLAYFDLNENKYIENEYKEVVEVTNLSGNISKFGKEFVFHVHATLGRKDNSLLGGHLSKAKIGATLEMVIYVFPKIVFERRYDQKTGLKKLTFVLPEVLEAVA